MGRKAGGLVFCAMQFHLSLLREGFALVFLAVATECIAAPCLPLLSAA